MNFIILMRFSSETEFFVKIAQAFIKAFSMFFLVKARMNAGFIMECKLLAIWSIIAHVLIHGITPVTLKRLE